MEKVHALVHFTAISMTDVWFVPKDTELSFFDQVYFCFYTFFRVQQTVHMFLQSQQFRMTISLDAFKVMFKGFDFPLIVKNIACFSQSLSQPDSCEEFQAPRYFSIFSFKLIMISAFVANNVCSLYRFTDIKFCLVSYLGFLFWNSKLTETKV